MCSCYFCPILVSITMARAQARAACRPNRREHDPLSESKGSNSSTDNNVPINNLVPPVAVFNAVNVNEPANVPAVVNMAIDEPLPPFAQLAVDAFDACLQRLTLMPAAIQHFHDQGFVTIDQMRHVPFESTDHILAAITKINVILGHVSISYLAMQELKELCAWILSVILAVKVSTLAISRPPQSLFGDHELADSCTLRSSLQHQPPSPLLLNIQCLF
jgi:hypothetical protein